MKTVVKFNLRPKVPPPEKANMEIQTDSSFLSDEPGCSSKEEVPTSSGGSQKREEPEEKKYNPRPQPKNLQLFFTMVKISLVMKIILSFKESGRCFQMGIMVNAQVFTIRVIQHFPNIDVSSSMPNTGRPANYTRTNGIQTLRSS